MVESPKRKVKVVYDDAGVNKVGYGYLEDLGAFVKLTDEDRSITINKRYIVCIKEG